MKRTSLIFGFTLATLVSLPALATPISSTLDLGKIVSGGTPDGSAPWLTAVFTGDTTSITGTLTLTSHLGGGDFLQGAGNAGWAFYLNDLDTSATITCSGKCPTRYSYSGFNTGPVHDDFNLGLFWAAPPISNRFGSGDSATLTLTFLNDLSGNPFQPLPVDNDYASVAHIQGLLNSNGRTCSAWIVNGSDGTATDATCGGGGVNVPEPADLGVFGTGVLLIGVFLGLRRRYN